MQILNNMKCLCLLQKIENGKMAFFQRFHFFTVCKVNILLLNKYNPLWYIKIYSSMEKIVHYVNKLDINNIFLLKDCHEEETCAFL